MDDALNVGRRQCAGDLDCYFEQCIERERYRPHFCPAAGPWRRPVHSRQAPLQCLTREIFHYDERLPVVLAEFMDSTDVRMIECRGGYRLTLESSERLSIFGHLVRQEFKSHEPSKMGILGFVHHTHSAAAQMLENAVVGNSPIDHGNAAVGDIPIGHGERTRPFALC
jgi:hypothetical protein